MNKATVAQATQATSSLRPTHGILQHKCGCGTHAMGGGQCTECARKKSGLQRKLVIGASNDPLEQEADRVADQVMTMPSHAVVSGAAHRIQRYTGHATGQVDSAPASVDQVLGSSGRPLEPRLQHDMGQRFGYDFSRVRVHTGTDAEQSARDVNAHAYTLGNSIVFGQGQYTPETGIGRRLIAHELVHVVQQSEGSSSVLQRVCGPAAIGTPRGCTLAPSVFSGGSLFRFNVECDDFSSGQEAALIAFVRVQPASATFKIHGYASIDGLAAFNQNLACARALKAQASMITGGIATSRITDVFNHGPTPGSAVDRRSVAIETITSARPAPRTGAITSQTVATSPGGRTRTTIGVGEEVDLTFSLGSTTWSTTAGTLTFVAGNPGPIVRFTAPDTAQFVTVTAGTAPTASIILFTVLAPTSIAMDRQPGTGVQHTLNRPDSGIQTRVFLGPDSVNFYRVIYHELDVAGTGTGVFSCNPSAGGHCGAGGGGVACPDKTVSSTVVVGKGTQSDLGDCALSGDCCGAATPFVAGTVTLGIPYEYKVGTGTFHAITNVPQVHALAADLTTLTSDKGGAHGQTTVAAASTSITQCPIGHC